MSTLAEIEAAIPNLNATELAELEKFVTERLQKVSATPRHSVLEIPVASVGAIL